MTRAVPVGGLALCAFIVGVVVAGGSGQAETQLVRKYVGDWSRGDIGGMYSLLDTASRRSVPESQFAARVQRASATATMRSLRLVSVDGRTGNLMRVRVRVQTRIFGTLHETLLVPLTTSGSDVRIQLGPSLLFPGLRPGEALTRSMQLPPRAALLAADGTPLATGPTRHSPIPDVAGQITGTLEPIPATEQLHYAALGYPPDAKVGHDGLERIFQRQLAGTPGGTLQAGNRTLASVPPRPGTTVRTTINPSLERAAVSAMGSNYAGIAVMDPRSGALLALAGVAFSALQPPGSTMKIITVSGVLSAGVAKPSSSFPVQTATDLDGFVMQNANGEACGGSLVNAFAVSCNSVFAPLGAKLGAQRFLAMAERFGFNQKPTIPGAAEPTIPRSSLNSTLAVGSSAIGQGEVQSTALEMTDAGATIADGGRRPLPTLQAGQPPRFVPVLSHHVAGEVQQMMVAVVQYGTGTSAQIPGVTIAGKTGTAELRDTAGGGSPQDTDAWFVGYGPVGSPRVVVGALFPENGAGGQTAAPAVRQVLAAALSGGH